MSCSVCQYEGLPQTMSLGAHGSKRKAESISCALEPSMILQRHITDMLSALLAWQGEGLIPGGMMVLRSGSGGVVFAHQVSLQPASATSAGDVAVSPGLIFITSLQEAHFGDHPPISEVSNPGGLLVKLLHQSLLKSAVLLRFQVSMLVDLSITHLGSQILAAAKKAAS